MRRKNRFRLLALSASLALCLAGCAPSQGEAQRHTKELFAMGTSMRLTAYGDQAGAALDEAQSRIAERETLWSATDEGSEIYQINHSGGQPVPIHPETEELLRFALKMAEDTGGALDPTIYPLVEAWGFAGGDDRVPPAEEIQALLSLVGYEDVALENHMVALPEGMQLDLGAVGKGYAGELLADSFRDRGITSALLDIGGNIQLVGGRPDGSPWRLGIKNPFGEGIFGILEAEDQAVVTSGGYERYFTDAEGRRYWHILDPATGYPADRGLASVTIVADSGALCDALSTAVFVMGLTKGVEYWKANGGFDMLLMTQEREIYLTEGIEGRFALDSSFAGREIHVIRR